MKIGSIIYLINRGNNVEKHVVIECDEKGEPTKSVRLDEATKERPYDKAYDRIDNVSDYIAYFKTKKEAYESIKQEMIKEKNEQVRSMEESIAKLEKYIATLE